MPKSMPKVRRLGAIGGELNRSESVACNLTRLGMDSIPGLKILFPATGGRVQFPPRAPALLSCTVCGEPAAITFDQPSDRQLRRPAHDHQIRRPRQVLAGYGIRDILGWVEHGVRVQDPG